MICPSYPDPQYFIFSADVPKLLYYSHLPAIAISLLIGFFVYFKNRQSLVSKILLSISITFSIWTFLSLITWTNNISEIIIFAWSFFGILYALLSVLCLYFIYVFIDKIDVSFNKKFLFSLLILPVIFFTPTDYNLKIFDLTVCGISNEGKYFTNYFFALGLIIFVWILILSILRYRKAEKEFKKQILLLAIGIELFLLSFFIVGFLASYLVDQGYISDFGLEFYGLFGMTIFMGFLAYLIVKYKAFDIKLLGVQALVVAQFIAIASMFAFATSSTNQILIGVTLTGTTIMGWYMVRSVKAEVKRKEELQLMSEKLSQANDQLRKLDNAKSEFISIASHQLRTPLTAIKGFVSLILEGT